MIQDTTILDESWPPFMGQLQTDPKQAFELFSTVAYATLQDRPPRNLAPLQKDKQEDIIQEILLHFYKNDCRVLRSYKDRGLSFKSWFYVVCSTKVREILAGTRPDADSDEPEDVLDTHSEDPARTLDIDAMVDRVLECLSKLRVECRLLILARAVDLSAVQQARLLGWPGTANKRASNMNGECRKTLRRCLDRHGLDLASVVPILA